MLVDALGSQGSPSEQLPVKRVQSWKVGVGPWQVPASAAPPSGSVGRAQLRPGSQWRVASQGSPTGARWQTRPPSAPTGRQSNWLFTVAEPQQSDAVAQLAPSPAQASWAEGSVHRPWRQTPWAQQSPSPPHGPPSGSHLPTGVGQAPRQWPVPSQDSPEQQGEPAPQLWPSLWQTQTPASPQAKPPQQSLALAQLPPPTLQQVPLPQVRPEQQVASAPQALPTVAQLHAPASHTRPEQHAWPWAQLSLCIEQVEHAPPSQVFFG